MTGTIGKIALIICVLALEKISYAQTSIEIFTTNDDLTMEAWWFKTLKNNPKFNFFSLNEATYNYNLETTQFMSYTIMGYELTKGFGPVVGARFLENRTSALGGIQYAYYTEKFFITTNFTSELRGKPFLEWYTLMQYRFPLSEKMRFFSQFQNSINFNSDGNDFSFQRLRIGLDFGFLQGGFGLNTTQIGKDWKFDAAPGVFIRLELK